MERERKINWLSLFIKMIIIFIFVLIIIWLASKIIGKTKLSDTFKNNITNMETVATNYYKGVDLPLEKGKSLKITLGEMIDKGLIILVNDKDKVSCNTTKSMSKITRKQNNYILSTTLNCGKEKETITKKFPLSDCQNCQNNKKNNDKKESQETNKEQSNQSNNTNNNENNSTPTTNNNNNSVANSGTTYYEYVKEWTTYTKWNKGILTGDNIENKYEYYEISNKEYYSLGIINESDFRIGNEISYTLKLVNVPNKNYYFTKIDNSSYYDHTEESKYLNSSDISLYKSNYNTPKSIDNYSITSNNFNYNLNPYYRKGNFYVDVEITITDTNNVSSYSIDNKNIYYIPLKFNIKFASNNVTTEVPKGEYETISYYRYVEKHRDVIWSSDSYVEGYTKTGNSEIR